MASRKSTPLTLEVFEEAILPRIMEMMDERLNVAIDKFRNEVLEFKDEVMGEIKAMREELAVALHQFDLSPTD